MLDELCLVVNALRMSRRDAELFWLIRLYPIGVHLAHAAASFDVSFVSVKTMMSGVCSSRYILILRVNISEGSVSCSSMKCRL